MVFRYFKDELLGRERWTDASISKPKPSLTDFEMNIVTIPDHLITTVRTHLDKTSFCLITGPPSGGKTWLTFKAAYQLSFIEKKHVWYTAVDETFRNEDAWKEIRHYYENETSDIYFVIEDCHLNPDEVERLLLRIYGERSRNRNVKFIITSRTIGKYVLRDDVIQDTFYNILVRRLKCRLTLSDASIREISAGMIKTFSLVKGKKDGLTTYELNSIAKHWGSDLYITYLHLRSARSSDLSEYPTLISAGMSRIYDSLWNGLGEICLKNTDQRQILCRIATVCQFEPLRVPEKFLRTVLANEHELSYLRKKGVIQVYSHGMFGLPEGLARLILSTIATKDPGFSFTDVEKSFGEYVYMVTSDPPLFSWSFLFLALFLGTDGNCEFIGRIRLSLLKDASIWAIIRERTQNLPLGSFRSLFLRISPLAGSEANELRKEYIRKNHHQILQTMKSSSIRRLRDYYIPMMSRLADLSILMGKFSASDFQKMLNRPESISSIRAVDDFFSCIERRNISNRVERTFAVSLVSLSNSDLSRLINQKATSLHRLTALVQRLKKVSGPLAEGFIKKLSRIDLNELFLKEDLEGIRLGLGKASEISYFISKEMDYSKRTCARGANFVRNIADATWFSVMKEASLRECFWLLWNIYIFDKAKAENLLRQGLTGSLLKKGGLHEKRFFINLFERAKKTTGEEQDYWLPLLGLLIECGFQAARVQLPINKRGRGPEAILPIIEKWSQEKPSPTLAVLSMIAACSIMKGIDKNKIIMMLRQEPIHTFIHDVRSATGSVRARATILDLVRKYQLD